MPADKLLGSDNPQNSDLINGLIPVGLKIGWHHFQVVEGRW